MLGQIKSTYNWHWIACGKHPAAGDYFQIGQSTPLVKAFSDWIKDGYRKWISKESNCADPHSWRFWATGSTKKELICGLSKDSSDTIGRKYPLLIIGTGPLREWEVHWDLLPFALENTWNQIEYLAAKRYLDFQQLEQEVRMILAPLGNWADLGAQADLTDNDEFRSLTSHVDLKNFKDNCVFLKQHLL